ncbi:MAG: Gfo/Idh/MocA family oxidoreductase, partial [Gammaproteobacteria bacterium]|nr:Gfo/Idh/MocA family oxidoreductase [Gammaproteobacteria bacterium]
MTGVCQPIRDRRIRFALAGCGRISAKHFEALEQHRENAEVVALCDTNEARLAQAVDRTGARGFQDYARLVEESGADIVVLATPSGLHPAQTTLAARAGMHVMTEKPMATRWRDGLAMVDACDAAGVGLF